MLAPGTQLAPGAERGGLGFRSVRVRVGVGVRPLVRKRATYITTTLRVNILVQIWISPERVGEKTGCLAFIGISRPYFAITNKTRIQGGKIRNKFKK